MSMSMTMMVPVRPMPALGREGGTVRGQSTPPQEGGPELLSSHHSLSTSSTPCHESSFLASGCCQPRKTQDPQSHRHPAHPPPWDLL